MDKASYRHQPPLMCPSCFRQEFMRIGKGDKRKYMCAKCGRMFDGMRTSSVGPRLARTRKMLQMARKVPCPLTEADAEMFQQWLEKVET